MLFRRRRARSTGFAAEKFACSYLVDQGLKLLMRNYRCKNGEIDLIMQEDDTIIFIEVRFRANTTYGSGSETVTKQKQYRIIKTALFYLKQKQLLEKNSCRFDVVSVTQHDLQPTLEWIKDAFQVGENTI